MAKGAAKRSCMRAYNFNAIGNYSDVSHWDNGLQGDVLEEIPATTSDKSGVEVTFHCEYGGTRNVRGIVVAPNRRAAKKLLADYCKKFAVIKYVEQD